jgi:hypothetical protein
VQISVYSMKDSRYTQSFNPSSTCSGQADVIEDFGFSGAPCTLMFALMGAPGRSLIAYQWQTNEPVAILQDTLFFSAAFNAGDDTKLLALESHRLVQLEKHARKASYVRRVIDNSVRRQIHKVAQLNRDL